MEYFISVKNEKRGPYTLNELRERNLDAATLVMPADSTIWIPAWQVDELRPIIEHSTTPNTTNAVHNLSNEGAQSASINAIQQEEIPYVQAKPVENYAPTTAYEPPLQAPQKKKSHGCLIAFLVLAFAFLVLCFTCPTKEDHKQALANVVTQTMNDATKQIDNTSDFGDIGQAFATMFLSTIERTIQSSIDNLLQVENYGVCSIGKINFGGQEKIVSVGILTHIFTFDKGDIEREISKRLQNEAENQSDSKLKQGIKGLIENGVIAPLTKSLKGTIGSVIDDLINDIAGNEASSSSQIPTDSI